MTKETKLKLRLMDLWVKTLNQKASIEQGDDRIGRRYAVVTRDDGNRPTYWTDFLPINTLYEVVRALMHYKSFIEIKEA